MRRATHGGRACGTLGRAGCFSFFSNKNLPVGEGGMIVTDDAELAERMRLLRSHGMTTLTWDRHRGHAHTYDVVAQGFNYRLDELRAAIGLVQLGRLESANAARAEIAGRYRELLDGADGLVMPFSEEAQASSSHHLAVVVLSEGIRARSPGGDALSGGSRRASTTRRSTASRRTRTVPVRGASSLGLTTSETVSSRCRSTRIWKTLRSSKSLRLYWRALAPSAARESSRQPAGRTRSWRAAAQRRARPRPPPAMRA